MTVVFISNYYNHHQAPFCQVMSNLLKENFVFIQTQEMEEERSSMGWGDIDLPAYVIKSYSNAFAEKECRRIIEQADVVIIGSAPNHFVKNRIKDGKIVIRYSERPLKKGLELWKYPYRYLKWHIMYPRHANVYLLCASAYTASDYLKFGLFRDRCYKWGYFPEIKNYCNVSAMIERKRPASILWVARLIELKHPELPIMVAKRLKEEHYSFEMNLIGSGILENKIKTMIREYCLEDCVKMLGTMKPNQVREHMEQSQVFLFTSDRNEGWGAVLNEAMNSACGVVASDAIGSVPYLIRHGDNGLIYRDGDFNDLYCKLKQLLDAPDRTAMLGQRAYETMTNIWNGKVAAERLLKLVKLLLKGETDLGIYEDGPCSKA